MKITPLFYQNPKGAYGVSFDEGETLWLPTGKVLSSIPDVWEETDQPEDSLLSAAQLTALKNHLSKPEMTAIEERAWEMRQVARNRPAYGGKRIDHEALYRRLEERGALVVKSDPED